MKDTLFTKWSSNFEVSQHPVLTMVTIISTACCTLHINFCTHLLYLPIPREFRNSTPDEVVHYRNECRRCHRSKFLKLPVFALLSDVMASMSRTPLRGSELDFLGPGRPVRISTISWIGTHFPSPPLYMNLFSSSCLWIERDDTYHFFWVN